MTPTPAVDFEGTLTDYAFAPRYSQNTKPVLAEAGLSEAKIDELKRTGIVPASPLR